MLSSELRGKTRETDRTPFSLTESTTGETGEKLVLTRLAEHPSSVYRLSSRAKGGLRLSLSSVQYQLKRLEERGFVKSSVGEVARGGGKEKIYSATPLGIVYLLSIMADSTFPQRRKIVDAVVSSYSSFLPLIFSKWQYFKQAGVDDAAWKALMEVCIGLRRGTLSIFKFSPQVWFTLVQIPVDKIPFALVNPSLLFSGYELAELVWAKSSYSFEIDFNSAVELALRQIIETQFIESASHAPLYDSEMLSEAERKRLEEAIVKDMELFTFCLSHIWRKRVVFIEQAFQTQITQNDLLDISLPSVSQTLKMINHLQKAHHVSDTENILSLKPQDMRERPKCREKLNRNPF